MQSAPIQWYSLIFTLILLVTTAHMSLTSTPVLTLKIKSMNGIKKKCRQVFLGGNVMPIVNVRVERIQEEHSRDERGIIWVSRETEFHDHACDSCGRIVSFGCEEEHCPSPTVG